MLRHNLSSVRKVHRSATVLKQQEKVTKLKSGLTVATVENNGPLTQLVLAFKAGSRYEQPHQAGLSHTLRNFVGRDSEQYFGTSIVWSSAASGALLKSFTTRDLFGVALTIPRDQTSTGLSILGQAAAVPGFKTWEVEDVVPTIRADNAYRTPYDFLSDQIHKAAFKNGGLGNSIYSPCSKIGSVKVEDLTTFANKHFVSGNSVLFATNANHEDVALYGENFSPIRTGTAVSTVQSAFKGGESRREAETKLAHVIIAGEGASGNNTKALATQAVLITSLGNSSPLKFTNKVSGVVGKLAQQNVSASAFQDVHSDSGLVGVYFVSENDSAKKAVDAVVDALKTVKFDNFEALKKQAYNNALRSKAHSDKYALERTAQLFQTQDNYIDAILNVSESDVKAAAAKVYSKLSIASYGNISQVPYIDEL